MKSLFLKALPAVLAGSALIAGARAFAADPATTQDVQQQLQALQAKVAQLEAQQQQSDQATVKSVLTDAEKRSQLMADSVDITSGYDKGFFIQSADKTFTLKPGMLLQVRNATNWRQEAKNGGASDDLQNGFEIRRFKLQASGNAYGPDVTYGLQITNNRNSAAIELDDIWVQYKFAPHNAVKAGQYKGPFNREELVSDGGQLAVERSLLNEVLGGGKAEALFIEVYKEFITLPSANTSYRQLFVELSDSAAMPALFHCTTGKDRTGWAAAIRRYADSWLSHRSSSTSCATGSPSLR